MKNLNIGELNQVSGGEKFLLFTSTVDFVSLPKNCLEKFFNNSTNLTLVGSTHDSLFSTLLSNCYQYTNDSTSFSSSTETIIIAASVIEQ